MLMVLAVLEASGDGGRWRWRHLVLVQVPAVALVITTARAGGSKQLHKQKRHDPFWYMQAKGLVRGHIQWQLLPHPRQASMSQIMNLAVELPTH